MAFWKSRKKPHRLRCFQSFRLHSFAECGKYSTMSFKDQS